MAKTSSSKTPKPVAFQKLLDALLDEETPFNPRYLYRLSDLDGKELVELHQLWANIVGWRRQALLEDMQTLVEGDYLLSFEAVARLGLTDSEPVVRLAAVQTLIANEVEAPDLLPVYLGMLADDPDEGVRSATASALARYLYLCEIDMLPSRVKANLEENLFKVYASDGSQQVQRAVLECLGYSSHPDVAGLIETAYHKNDRYWMASALFAMARSANKRWGALVLQELGNNHASIRLEAARAAGELSLKKALPAIARLATNDDDDSVRRMAVWAMSQIGGVGVREYLTQKYESAEDPEEMEFFADALDNLEFNEGMDEFDIMDVDEIDPEALAGYDELELDWEEELGDDDEFLLHELEEDEFDDQEDLPD